MATLSQPAVALRRACAPDRANGANVYRMTNCEEFTIGAPTETTDEPSYVGPDVLTAMVERTFVAIGSDKANAAVVAERLLVASVAGVDTHGVLYVPLYVRAIQAGHLDPQAKPTTDRASPTSARVRRHWGFGHVAALTGTRIGIAKAKAFGCAPVAIVECGHVGRVGHYVEEAARSGFVALMFAGGYGVETPVAVPFGGGERVLHTNPVAFASPGGSQAGPVSDFATTAVAGMKSPRPDAVGLAYHRNRSWIIKVSPRTTRARSRPAVPSRRSGPQGTCHHDSGGMAQTHPDRGGLLRRCPKAGPVMRHQGLLECSFARTCSPDRTGASGRDAMVERIQRSAPAPGMDRVVIPGGPEAAARRLRAERGIPIDEGLWRDLLATAKAVGVQL